MSENIGIDTVIPDYILQALAHSSRNVVDTRVIKLMGLYRIKNAASSNLHALAGLNSDIVAMENLSTEDFINQYVTKLPDDLLTDFIEYLFPGKDWGKGDS